MNVIVLPVELDERRLEILAQARKEGPHRGEMPGREDMAAIFGHKDQMNVEDKDAVPASSEVGCICHRPMLP